MGESFGLKAKDFMSRLLNGKQVTCKPDRTVSFDRKVATCFLDGEDIAIPLLREGLIRLSWRPVSGGIVQKRGGAACHNSGEDWREMATVANTERVW